MSILQWLTTRANFCAISSTSVESGSTMNNSHMSTVWRTGVPDGCADARVPNAPRRHPVNRYGGPASTAA